jgi:glycerophosphoryl diester phosphodiesterase
MPHSANPYRPEIHGHRGCRGLFPENTISAFLHALALGVDVLEMDVIISADNQVVVSHEPWLNPTICLDPAGQPIELSNPPLFNLYQMPYHIIRQCDCGLLRHPAFPNQQTQPAYKPLLGEVLITIAEAVQRLGRNPVRFSIEIKSLPEGDNIYHPEPAQFLFLVLAELFKAQVIPQTTLLCFDTRILQLAHQQQPNLATCLLLEQEQPWLLSLQALDNPPTALGPDFRTVTPEAVQQLRAYYPSLRLVPWTANSVTDMQHLVDLRVDGITTDYPNTLATLLMPHSA